jgi:hypothetical protein
LTTTSAAGFESCHATAPAATVTPESVRLVVAVSPADVIEFKINHRLV